MYVYLCFYLCVAKVEKSVQCSVFSVQFFCVAFYHGTFAEKDQCIILTASAYHKKRWTAISPPFQ